MLYFIIIYIDYLCCMFSFIFKNIYFRILSSHIHSNLNNIKKVNVININMIHSYIKIGYWTTVWENIYENISWNTKLWEVDTNVFLRRESRLAITAVSIVWIDRYKILAKQPKMVSWKFIIRMHIQERNLITYIHNLQARIVT